MQLLLSWVEIYLQHFSFPLSLLLQCPKINRKSYIRVAPWKRNVIKTLITKKPKDRHSRHVVEVREAIQKVDPTIPSTQSPSQHFIWVSSKKSCPVGGLCGEYASVVTEYSDPKVQEVAQVEENLELSDLQIKGTQLKQRRKKVNHQPRVAKPPLPLPQAMNQTTTTVEHPAGSSVSFEAQVTNSKTKNPARRTKRKRKTREELEAKQAAAAQRRMVCLSTTCILFEATPIATISFVMRLAIHVALTVALALSQLGRNWSRSCLRDWS